MFRAVIVPVRLRVDKLKHRDRLYIKRHSKSTAAAINRQKLGS